MMEVKGRRRGKGGGGRGGGGGEYRWQYIFEWDDSYVNVF